MTSEGYRLKNCSPPESLNEHLFQALHHARHLMAACPDDYNHHCPHSSLDELKSGNQPTHAFARFSQVGSSQLSTAATLFLHRAVHLGGKHIGDVLAIGVQRIIVRVARMGKVNAHVRHDP